MLKIAKRITSLLFLTTIVSFTGLPAHCHAKNKERTSPKRQAPADEQLIINSAVVLLDNYEQLINAVSVQNVDIACAMRKAYVMADLLIQADGSFNATLCPLVKAGFVPAYGAQEYEVKMGKVLDHLDPAFFKSVKAPTTSHAGSLAIRALFSLSPDQPITDRHAKVAVLTALLAPFNQGPVGDCFAVADVIRDHEEYYAHAAADYQAIAMNGYIQRAVNAKNDYFFFLPVLADTDRDQGFLLRDDGNIGYTNHGLFDAPGFAVARAMMGGAALDTLLYDVLAILKPISHSQQDRVTPAQVIAAMAEAIDAANKDALISIGEYAFSSQTNNTILRGVEAAFAAMAEDRENDSTRSNINSSVYKAIDARCSHLKSMKGVKQFQQSFAKAFNGSYRLLYNLNIPLAQVSEDGSSTDGGFQLYKRDLKNAKVLGTQVVTPEDLRNLITSAVDSTAEQLGNGEDVQNIAQALFEMIRSEGFLEDVLWNYDSANKKEADPVANYTKLARTPMQSCDGDNPFEVNEIDTQMNYEDHVQTYTPKNAQDLITWCLTLAKKVPAELIPMDSPQHAFNFVPNNPDIIAFLAKDITVTKWLQTQLVTTGLQVSRKLISSDVQEDIAKGMYEALSNALPDRTEYDQLVAKLAKGKLCVRDYARRMVDGVNKILGSDKAQAAEVALVFDDVLVQNLSVNDVALLNQSAIRFAFTNWNEGTKDIYFCAFFNPRTEAIGFGSIFEDKTHLQPMDENAWVNHQQWDVDMNPFAPKDAA